MTCSVHHEITVQDAVIYSRCVGNPAGRPLLLTNGGLRDIEAGMGYHRLSSPIIIGHSDGAHLAIVPFAGHALFQEQPDRIAPYVKEFIAIADVIPAQTV